MFETYCKFDKNQLNKMSYKSYIQMGSNAQLTPSIISSQDYIYIYKTIMKQKKLNYLSKLTQNATNINSMTASNNVSNETIDLESSKLDL